MEKKEIPYEGLTLNGFLMLFVSILVTLGCLALIVYGIEYSIPMICVGVLVLILSTILWCGFLMLEPNEARVITFFGKYRGTFTKTGYYWINPFCSTKKLSLRARNMDAEPIKVNDKTGNPIMIGLVLVWRLKDTYKAMFEIDSQTMASPGASSVGSSDTKSLMAAFERFVRVQSDAALRQVAGQYAYDNTDEGQDGELTLRDGSDEINKELERKLDERLDMAGIEVVEARINYLAYAPEIAAVTAREKIVEGAVSMVKMALKRLSDEEVVELDDDKKAAMVSNLMVVLCGDESAQPVVNTGTLNH